MKLIARTILWIEPLLIATTVASFWFYEPFRASNLWFFIPPIVVPMAARLVLYRRLWVNSPLNILLYLFLFLCAINTYIALHNPLTPPYSNGWFEIGRPIIGVMLALSIMSIAYERGRLDAMVLVVLLFGVLIGVLGLTSAQFIDKSAQLQFIINHLPQI